MKNVIFLFADDMRSGMISDPAVYTPNLERLAASGMMFSNAHIPGGTSGAVCMPSRAMLHTGRLLEGLERAGRHIPHEHIMLGEVLRSSGYETYGIGKWHNGTDSFTRSFSDGAEIFFGGMEDHWNVPANDYDPTGRYEKTIRKSVRPYLSNSTATFHCDHISPGKHSSELFADASIDFIENYDEEEPFFLYTAFMAPHDPRTMPMEFLRMYDMNDIDLPESFMPEHPFDFGISNIRDEILAPYPREENEVRRHIWEYYAMVTHLDACIGRILDAIEEKGLVEETIIIFAADNGLAVGCHGLMGKQNLYEHSVRVPLIMSGPGIPAGTLTDSPVFIADLYPTILEMLDIGIPDTCFAKSLLPVIESGTAVRDTLLLRYKNSVAGIKKDGYKLIKYMLEEGVRFSLFYLPEDPHELNDLSDIPEYKDIVNILHKELDDKWRVLETS